MIKRSRRFKSGFLHKADFHQPPLRLAKLHLSHPRQVVLAMCTRFLKVRGLPLRGINGRRRSHVGRFGLCSDVAVHITLKPLLLVASSDGSLARVSGIASAFEALCIS